MNTLRNMMVEAILGEIEDVNLRDTMRWTRLADFYFERVLQRAANKKERKEFVITKEMIDRLNDEMLFKFYNSFCRRLNICM